MKSSIGIDIGTTSICGILMDCASGAVRKTENRKNDAWIASASAWEKIQSPERIMELVFEIIHALWEENICSIGVTGQMHGILYTDENGLALSPLYTWQDGRAGLAFGDSTYCEQIGAPAGYGLATDLYNQKNNLVPASAAAITTIHDYAVMCLTGRKKPWMHTSDAASLGRFDVKNNCFTVSNPHLPDFTDKTAVAGDYCGVPVSVAIGDNQASFIGSGCGNGVLVNVGTGSQISFLSDGAEKSGLELRPLYGEQSILVGSALCGGRSFALLEKFFEQVVEMVSGKPCGSLYPQMDALLAQGGDTEVVFHNLFCGARDNPEARASIENISEENFTPRDFMLGCLYGIVDELYCLYDLTGKHCDRLVGSGNGIRYNPALKRAFSERFGAPMLVSKHREEAAFGAAMFSMLAAGVYRSLDEMGGLIQYE